MAMARFLVACFLLVSPVLGQPGPHPVSLNQLKLKLQLILDKGTAEGLGMGLQLGVDMPHGTLQLASGFSFFDPNPVRHRKPVRAKPSDIFLMGSTTKMYTAAAVLRLVHEERFALDDRALPLMDSLYKKLTNGSSLVSVLGPRIRLVTVRELLSMRSGIPDFDDRESREYQLAHPQEDLGPVKNIAFAPAPNHNNSCTPGACGMYSSTNYELLGLILAQQANTSSWDTYDQADGIPGDLLKQLGHTKFGVHGTCQEYGTVHGITIDGVPKRLPSDVYTMSCTNGWACGNLLSTAGDAAKYVRALLGPGERVLSADLQKEMLEVRKLTQGWSVGLPYGLGIMDLSGMLEQPTGTIVGHGGATYGFLSFTGYMADLDIGFSIVANIEDPVISRVAKEAIDAVNEQFAAPTLAPPLMVLV